MVLAFLYIILKPDAIIDFLKLDKGFDEDAAATIKIDGEAFAKGGLVAIAAYFFIQNFSEFLFVAYAFIKARVNGSGFEDFLGNTYPQRTTADLVIIGLNLAVAWVIMTNVSAISRFLSQEEKLSS
jgi:hypothetical protein